MTSQFPTIRIVTILKYLRLTIAGSTRTDPQQTARFVIAPRAKLEGLNQLELAKIKEAFIRNKHQRFLKEFFSHLPYGKTEVYKREVENANLEKLARMIKICGFLLQSKVYLFCAVKELSLRAGAGMISPE